jgi:hypothetical protein
MLLFLPPRIQALIGLAVIVTGLALHSIIIAALGGVGLVIGTARWAHSRHNQPQR